MLAASLAASLAESCTAGLALTAPPPHQGTLGKRALFLAKSATRSVPIEITGA